MVAVRFWKTSTLRTFNPIALHVLRLLVLCLIDIVAVKASVSITAFTRAFTLAVVTRVEIEPFARALLVSQYGITTLLQCKTKPMITAHGLARPLAVLVFCQKCRVCLVHDIFVEQCSVIIL
jgi:hypothetical protein